MKKALTVSALAVTLILLGACQTEKMEKQKSGEALFNEYCAICHPNGGNIVSPEHPLHKEHLKTTKITTPEDIVHVMRNPGPGMTKFDEQTIPDRDALKIGEYILNTF